MSSESAQPTPRQQSTPADPLVSIVMPIRNEAAYIDACLASVLRQDYPADKIEVIVADGRSNDGTREILAGWQAREPRLRVLDNSGLTAPVGKNLGITASRGEIVVLLDGHTEVASDFIAQQVALLNEHPGAWTVGGPIVHRGKSLVGQSIAAAMSHPCGVGNAAHRFAHFEGYGEGAAFAAYRRWVFDRVGLFDERLSRNEDDELFFRIAVAGGKNFISPRIRYTYYVRDRLDQLFWQYFQYSFWRLPVMRKHGRPTTLRQVAPALFYLLMLVLGVVGVATGNWVLALGLPLAYLLVLVVVGVSLLPRIGAAAALVPLAMFTMHVAYASGMWYSVWAALFCPRAWDTEGMMTRLSR